MLPADHDRATEYQETSQRIRTSDQATAAKELADLAGEVRRTIVSMIGRAGMGHVGGDLSVTDLLVTCVWGALNLDPANPTWAGRDRIILSKGHCVASLYATLSRCGFFEASQLDTFMKPQSALNGHPNRNRVPGIETNTGALGHGLPVAAGCAYGARLGHEPWRTVVILGDGEMQEGSNWEAMMMAAHYRLSSLTAIIDRNRLQQGARTEDTARLEPLGEKLRGFGWEVREIDGHDHAAILTALGPSRAGQPVAIIANTIKGKGVSFMENRAEWHHKVPSSEQVASALLELAR